MPLVALIYKLCVWVKTVTAWREGIGFIIKIELFLSYFKSCLTTAMGMTSS